MWGGPEIAQFTAAERSLVEAQTRHAQTASRPGSFWSWGKEAGLLVTGPDRTDVPDLVLTLVE